MLAGVAVQVEIDGGTVRTARNRAGRDVEGVGGVVDYDVLVVHLSSDAIGVEDEVVPAIGRKHRAAEQSRLPAAGPDAPAAGAPEGRLMSGGKLGTATRHTELDGKTPPRIG